MTPAPQNNESYFSLECLSPDQAAQIRTLIERVSRQLQSLTPQERSAYLTLWTLLAQTSVPVALAGLHRRYDARVQSTLENLLAAGLVSYDRDLKSIMECPPFSALTTPHRVKTFGWNTAHVCSFLDAPLSLLLYGPNTWLEVRSTSPQTGTELTFRIMLDDGHHLVIDAPEDAANWRVLVQINDNPALHPAPRLQAHIFSSLDALTTYQRSRPGEPGVAYTLEEIICFSECLLNTYKQALSD